VFCFYGNRRKGEIVLRNTILKLIPILKTNVLRSAAGKNCPEIFISDNSKIFVLMAMLMQRFTSFGYQ